MSPVIKMIGFFVFIPFKGKNTKGRLSSCIGAATGLENRATGKTVWGSGPQPSALGELGEGIKPAVC